MVNFGVRFFIIADSGNNQYPEYTAIKKITADVRPDLVLTNSKTQAFQQLANAAVEFNCRLLHLESDYVPFNLSKKVQQQLKYLQGNINIFTQPDIVENWEFVDRHKIIPYGVDTNYVHRVKPKKIKVIKSNILPILAMAEGHIPVVLRNKYTESIIKDGENGFLFQFGHDLKIIDGMIENMSEKEKILIGSAARKTVETNFQLEPMLNEWLKIIRSV